MPRMHGEGIGMGPPWWHGRFRGRGYRITVPRQEILRILSRTEEHLSAEDIYFRLHRASPGIGLTTVYRTLELLTRMGILVKYDFGDGKARYELKEGPKGSRHHHHLFCVNCGMIVDYTDFVDEEKELLSRTEKHLSKKYDFKIMNHQIHFYGLCRKCR